MMFEAATRIVRDCMQIKPGTNLLVVSDHYVMPQTIGRAIAAAAEAAEARVSRLVIPAVKLMGTEPSPAVAAAALASNMIFVAGEHNNPLGHTNVFDAVPQKSIRMYGTIGVSESYFCRPFDPEQLRIIKMTTNRVADLLSRASKCRITSANGTDITLSLHGRSGKGANPLDGVLVPDYAEAAIAPVEETAEGTVVIDEVDGWMYPLREPLKVAVERGRMVRVLEGNSQEKDRFKELLETDQNANVIAELGLGTSHLIPARVTGLRYDFGFLGTCHLAIGRNTYLGGNTRSTIHVDCQIAYPSISLDGTHISKDGQLVVR